MTYPDSERHVYGSEVRFHFFFWFKREVCPFKTPVFISPVCLRLFHFPRLLQLITQFSDFHTGTLGPGHMLHRTHTDDTGSLRTDKRPEKNPIIKPQSGDAGGPAAGIATNVTELGLAVNSQSVSERSRRKRPASFTLK